MPFRARGFISLWSYLSGYSDCSVGIFGLHYAGHQVKWSSLSLPAEWLERFWTCSKIIWETCPRKTSWGVCGQAMEQAFISRPSTVTRPIALQWVESSKIVSNYQQKQSHRNDNGNWKEWMLSAAKWPFKAFQSICSICDSFKMASQMNAQKKMDLTKGPKG